jgi:hypothetical protein
MQAYVNTHEDLDEAARAFISDLDGESIMAELFPIVRNAMANQVRTMTRAAEREVRDNPGGVGGLFEHPADRDRMLGKRFAVNGHFVWWIEATADEHLEYAAERRRLASGNIATATIHEAAANTITKNGVTCLGDMS